MPEDSEPPPNVEAEIVSTSSAVQNKLNDDAEVIINTDCSSSGKHIVWEPEGSDAPKG